MTMIYYEDFLSLIQLIDITSSGFERAMSNIEILVEMAHELNDAQATSLHEFILIRRSEARTLNP